MLLMSWTKSTKPGTLLMIGACCIIYSPGKGENILKMFIEYLTRKANTCLYALAKRIQVSKVLENTGKHRLAQPYIFPVKMN